MIGKSKSYLCWVCQRNNTHILRAVNMPEAMKSATHLRQDQHLCAYSKTFAEEQGISELGRGDNPAASFHYSFDFAQQMHYPANPLQPRPVFFKMQLFGVQGGQCGSIASAPLLGKLRSRREPPGGVHGDNFAGQNKNKQMMHAGWTSDRAML